MQREIGKGRVKAKEGRVERVERVERAGMKEMGHHHRANASEFSAETMEQMAKEAASLQTSKPCKKELRKFLIKKLVVRPSFDTWTWWSLRDIWRGNMRAKGALVTTGKQLSLAQTSLEKAIRMPTASSKRNTVPANSEACRNGAGRPFVCEVALGGAVPSCFWTWRFSSRAREGPRTWITGDWTGDRTPFPSVAKRFPKDSEELKSYKGKSICVWGGDGARSGRTCSSLIGPPIFDGSLALRPYGSEGGYQIRHGQPARAWRCSAPGPEGSSWRWRRGPGASQLWSTCSWSRRIKEKDA